MIRENSSKTVGDNGMISLVITTGDACKPVVDMILIEKKFRL